MFHCQLMGWPHSSSPPSWMGFSTGAVRSKPRAETLRGGILISSMVRRGLPMKQYLRQCGCSRGSRKRGSGVGSRTRANRLHKSVKSPSRTSIVSRISMRVTSFSLLSRMHSRMNFSVLTMLKFRIKYLYLELLQSSLLFSFLYSVA
jgi:hypothetical protein